MLVLRIKVVVFCALFISLTACNQNVDRHELNEDFATCYPKNQSMVDDLYDTLFTLVYEEAEKIRRLESNGLERDDRRLGKMSIPNLPENIQDTIWVPSDDLLRNIDAKFPTYVNKCPPFVKDSIHEPIASDQQIFGLVLNDRKYVFINGFYPINISGHFEQSERFPDYFVFFMDGGPSYFHAIYDVELGAFIYVRYNGLA